LELKFLAYGRGSPLNRIGALFPAGLFEFIQKNVNGRQPGPLIDGHSWLVPVPVVVNDVSTHTSHTGDVVVRVEFEREPPPAFPPRDRWLLGSDLHK
jgi:hypothetical protein